MPFVFEQPNLDVPEENHLYFDPGDGRLLTFFVRPTRKASGTSTIWRSMYRELLTRRLPSTSSN